MYLDGNYVSYASQKLVSLFTSAMKRFRTSLFINNDCFLYVFISYIVVIIILIMHIILIQIACVFNKYVLSIYSKWHANVSF